MRHPLIQIVVITALVIAGVRAFNQHDQTAVAEVVAERDATIAELESAVSDKAMQASSAASEQATQLADARKALQIQEGLFNDQKLAIAKIPQLEEEKKRLADANQIALQAAEKLTGELNALQHKLDNYQCPAPDHTKCQQEIAELKKQLAACAEKSQSIPDPKPVAAAAPDHGQALPWTSDLVAAETEAARLGRDVFIDFEMVWPDGAGLKNGVPYCKPCHEVKRDVYQDPAVSKHLHTKYVCVWLPKPYPGVDKDTESFGVDSFPSASIERGSESRTFNPARTPEAFLKQLEAEKAKL